MLTYWTADGAPFEAVQLDQLWLLGVGHCQGSSRLVHGAGALGARESRSRWAALDSGALGQLEVPPVASCLTGMEG